MTRLIKNVYISNVKLEKDPGNKKKILLVGIKARIKLAFRLAHAGF